MIRLVSLGLAVGIGILHVPATSGLAWPHQVTVADLRGRPAPFRVVAHGAVVMVETGEHSGTPVLRRIAAGDTLRASTPAVYPVDLTGGTVVFTAVRADTLRLVVGGNPWGAMQPVRAQGRHFIVRLKARSVSIEAR